MTGPVPHTWILGLGVTGLSVVRHLAGQGQTLAVWDTRATPPGADTLAQGYPDVALRTGPFDGETLSQAKRLVVSPGLDLRTPALAQAIAAGVEVVGDIELFARAADAPVIGITGSNGKSTVTTLLGHLARECGASVGVGGNIGTPALDLLNRGHGLYVLELSSFQLETTRSLNAVAGTVLNVSPDHLDRYDSYEAYRDAKLALYPQCDTCVVNRADANTQAPESAHVVSFGPDAPADGQFGIEGDWLMLGGERLKRRDALSLVGAHNEQNILAALALGHAAGLAMAPMLAALDSYRGLPHRCELITQIQGVRYVNDSKATNLGATQAALEGLEIARVWLIAGGDAKGQDLSPLAPAITGLAGLITLGQDGPAIAAMRADAIQVDGIEAAVEIAAAKAREGDIVLLSPACSSLDMYASFEQRGQRFADAARRLK
ncbi:UDP-N-acetylmuramoyl-L-alanine--D-glutamate ligase [Ferrimonas balearica]|uniref:UDP-N-acetylmuramoyl-L-alanine--D-glutamate ligase n=1 Tax=Ferrimonas balearica TaxID=44012 RepID=UPI001C99AC19|nr:UDP-N-acetylmuramoyl-L-alanine--D-glutamate ligase [Ferrimonas balearica]MBY5923201.1 UDP-N-acetylmuramoyl-L-alanine--D-glutamate ligase [Ferrimonas balearica]MBY5997423.1 UDP-N-acetylmuramoyl-L-alanine--D-glutamate ligase [Ferrimonas balearica]